MSVDLLKYLIQTNNTVEVSRLLEDGKYIFDNSYILDIISPEMLSLLVNYDIIDENNINTQNESGETLLHIAMFRNSLPLTKMLLNYGANPNITDIHNSTPLHYAKRLNIAELLLDYDANINIHDELDRTPLDIALEENNLQIIALLQINKENMNIDNNNQQKSGEKRKNSNVDQIMQKIQKSLFLSKKKVKSPKKKVKSPKKKVKSPKKH
jgi:ankyrin repeat protein